MKSSHRFGLRAGPGAWWRAVSLATLRRSACSITPEVQSQQPVKPVETTASPSSMHPTLLAVIQENPPLGIRPFCSLASVGKQGVTISRIVDEDSEKYQAWVDGGSFMARPISGSAFMLVPKSRDPDVLSHATNPAFPTPRVCLGTSQITVQANLRQINPTKFTARAILTPTLAPWVTPGGTKGLGGPTRVFDRAPGLQERE